MEEQFKEEFRIEEDSMVWFEAKIAKLNKVANELGCKPVKFNIIKEEYVDKHIYSNPEISDFAEEATFKELQRIITIKVFTIQVEGEAPKLAGWEFLGTLEHTEAGTITRIVPGQEIPNIFRDAKPICDHCKTRRIRKDTYVVKHEDGTLKQVGSNCLRDFLGHSSPEKIARLASWLADLQTYLGPEDEDDYPTDKSYKTYIDLDIYLQHVAIAIHEDGWISNTKAREEYRDSTSYTAYENMHDRKYKPRKIFKASDYPEIALSLEWIRSLEVKPEDSEYLHNLKVACTSDMTESRNRGLVASLIPTYQKAMEIEIKRVARLTNDQKSRHFGKIGDRITRKLLISHITYIESQWGETTLHKMLDEDGNIFTWFASNHELVQGEWYEVKGTIKAHQDYKGIKQTLLTRCKAI